MTAVDEHSRSILGVSIFLAMFGAILGLGMIGRFDLQSVFYFLGIGVAASLVASGLAGIFSLWIITPASAKSLKQVLESTIGRPAHILDERQFLNRAYSDLTKNGVHIDIISLSLAAFTEHTHSDTLMGWLRDGKVFRILVLSPSSVIAKYRGEDEGINLGSKIIDSLKRLQRFGSDVERAARVLD